jgi:hypothetical protein
VGTTTFAGSTGSVGTPNNTFSFLFQILLLEDLLASLGV